MIFASFGFNSSTIPFPILSILPLITGRSSEFAFTFSRMTSVLYRICFIRSSVSNIRFHLEIAGQYIANIAAVASVAPIIIRKAESAMSVG